MAAAPTLGACRANIEQVLGREMTKEERSAVSRRVGDLMKQIDKTDKSAGAIGRVLQAFKDEKEAKKEYGLQSKALDWRAYSDLKTYSRRADAILKHPGEVFTAIMRGSIRNFEGAKDSLTGLVQKEAYSRKNNFTLELMQNKVDELAFSGTADKQINQSIWNIRNGIDNTNVDPRVAKIAEIIDKHTEKMRNDMNAEGAWIPKNDDRTFPRKHDYNRIARAGGNTWGSNEANATWSKFVDERMDWSKAFNGDLADATQGERQQRLTSLFTQFTADTHLKFSPDGFGPGKKFGLSPHRELVFKSPDADLEYQQTYGRGNSISEAISNNLGWNGKQLAMLKKIGVNGEGNLRRFVEEWKQELTAKGDHKGLEQLDRAYKSEMHNTWSLLTDSVAHPSDNFIGRFMSSVREVTNTAATASSIFALPTDLMLKARIMSRADRGSFLGSLVKATIDQFTPKGLTPEQRIQFAAEGAIRLEVSSRPMDDSMHDHAAYGAISKAMGLIRRMTGHAPWDNSSRMGSLIGDATYYHNLKSKSFLDMSKGEQDTLARFGVTHMQWEAIRKVDSQPLPANHGMGLQPSDIYKSDLDNFKHLAQGANPSDVTLRRIRDRVGDSMRNLYGENADRAVSAPSLSRNAMLRMGTGFYDPNTIHGWAALQSIQLKGWAINYMSEHLGGALHNQYSQYRSTGDAMMDMMMGKNNQGAKAILQMVSAGTSIAYATNALKQIAQGKSPINPLGNKPGAAIAEQPWEEAFQDAFARGSLGLYSDFFLGKGRPDEGLMDKVGKIVLGPEGELGANVYDQLSADLKQSVSKGGYTQKRVGQDMQKAFGLAYHAVPATNLFWTKAVSDYFILNYWSEMMNPGYQKRLTDAAKKHDQYYLAGQPGMKP